MRIDESFVGLSKNENGIYIFDGDLICDDDIEIVLPNLLLVSGSILSKKSINAGCGIKAGRGIVAGERIEAGRGIVAGWGIEAGRGIEAKHSISAGVFATFANKIICASIKGVVCTGEVVIRSKED